MAKKQQGMTNWQKIGLTSLVIGTFAFIKVAFFPGVEQPQPSNEVVKEEVIPKHEETNQDVPKSYVNVYFIGQNADNDEVYKIVKREYNAQKEGTKLRFSIESLLRGPNKKEKAKGVYSEVPAGTRLISMEETPSKIVINLSGDFDQGGGTDGLYKRLYQLIKTANKNTTLDVYLNINGKQADVVGGEGIMLNQPLNEKSLDD